MGDVIGGAVSCVTAVINAAVLEGMLAVIVTFGAGNVLSGVCVGAGDVFSGVCVGSSIVITVDSASVGTAM